MRATALAVAALAGACGDNLTGPAFEPWQLDELSPAEGLWVRTGEFSVPAGTEIQDCYFFELPAGGADLWIDRFQLALNPGSHHMNLFRVNTVVELDPAAGEPIDLGGVQGTVIRGGACWNATNWADWPLVVNSQQSTERDPVFEWSLPPTVAMRFAPGARLMLQVHYVNASTQETPFLGRAGLNMLSSDDDTVELGALVGTQQDIRICRSTPQPVYAGRCAMPNGGEHRVAAVNGHFHSRGQRFSVYAWDGVASVRPPDSARFYDSDEWAEPDMLTGLNVPLPAAGGIWWTCEYRWREPEIGCAAVDMRDPLQANDCCYTFGGTVETSEHCNVFLYYHPKTEAIDCFSLTEAG